MDVTTEEYKENFRKHSYNAHTFAKGTSVAESRWHAGIELGKIRGRLAHKGGWDRWLKAERISSTTVLKLDRLARLPLEKAALMVPIKGWLYLLQLSPPGRIKVGFTSKTVKSRLASAQTYVPDAVLLSQWTCEQHWEWIIHEFLTAMPSSVTRMGRSEVFCVADAGRIQMLIEVYVRELNKAALVDYAAVRADRIQVGIRQFISSRGSMEGK